MKTSELTGAALDWAVAKCMGQENCWMHDYKLGYPVPISTDWSQGGPIIEREKISTKERGGTWMAVLRPQDGSWPIWGYGPTPLIAAMRCYVASKLGDKVELPDTFI